MKRRRKTVKEKARAFASRFLWHKDTVTRDEARTLMKIAYTTGHESGRRS